MQPEYVSLASAINCLHRFFPCYPPGRNQLIEPGIELQKKGKFNSINTFIDILADKSQ